ncbi:hypothetical protein GW17_00026478 [Ensete ventricosum]|nr:hypothetical protein GW17_00026478 [Ensete ventricosum]
MPFYVPLVAWTRPMACEAAAAGVRGRGRYCMGWLLDAALATRGSLLMRQWSAACGRPSCDCRLMRLSPTRDRPIQKKSERDGGTLWLGEKPEVFVSLGVEEIACVLALLLDANTEALAVLDQEFCCVCPFT